MTFFIAFKPQMMGQAVKAPAAFHAVSKSGCAAAGQQTPQSIAKRRPALCPQCPPDRSPRSEEHTSELQSLMRISYAVFCLKKKNNEKTQNHRRRRRTK